MTSSKAAGRLAWAVDLAQADLASYTPAEWDRLRRGLVDFLRPRASSTLDDFAGLVPVPKPISEGDLGRYPAAGFRRLQRDLRRLIEPLVDASTLESRGSRSSAPLANAADYTPVTFSGSFVPRGLRGAMFTTVRAAPRDLVVFMTLALLIRLGYERVGRCPKCARVFVRASPRQRYCRRPCTAGASRKKAPRGRARR